MKLLTITFIIFIGLNLECQNLVLNPSFEEHASYKCIVNLGGFNQQVLDWSIPNYGSTDFFDACSVSMGNKNYNGFQKPKTGTSYAGMYFYTDKNYREYVQGQISETLVKGKAYKVTFYLSLADKSSYALKDINVLITEEKLKPCYHSNSCEKIIKPKKATNWKFKMYSNPKEIYFSEKDSWMEYTFEFTAEGYENYFSIGNFYRNKTTKKQKVLSTSNFLFSYYYIDDVSIEPLEKEVTAQVVKQAIKEQVKINEVYTFKTIIFDFDKATLLEDSIEELNQLYNYLNTNSNLKVEIYGHTDNVGLDKPNKELSDQRAKAVADYLISQGLNELRIKSLGFGSTEPVSDNNTDEGRQLNRRVEFKLLEN